MNPDVRKQLEYWRKDYASVVGTPFERFSCPILGTDEDVPLQKGHIINEAFRNSARAWIVQRRDVDSF
ncbi:MAG: hypothetical protein JWN86_3938 [Planctomycetota bacterium]|nr:hypothetical protein [Planctomycetota bacterium]